MSNDVRSEQVRVGTDAGEGPLRHFRVGRRAVLTSLTGLGAAAFALPATSAHVHHAATAAAKPADSAATADGSLLFLDQHAFDTLALLSEQIVPGSRAAQVPEVLDRLLSVEAIDTQKRFMQALGAFEGQAREAQGKPWKALSAAEANALLTKLSTLPDGDNTRGIFDGFKRAIAETYYSTEPGEKELGYNGNFAFAAPPAGCA
jgi:hypothetical protein